MTAGLFCCRGVETAVTDRRYSTKHSRPADLAGRRDIYVNRLCCRRSLLATGVEDQNNNAFGIRLARDIIPCSRIDEDLNRQAIWLCFVIID